MGALRGRQVTASTQSIHSRQTRTPTRPIRTGVPQVRPGESNELSDLARAHSLRTDRRDLPEKPGVTAG